jgi:hypothetical protein
MLLAAVALSLTACGSGDSASDTATGGDAPTLVIGGIPDQEVLDERTACIVMLDLMHAYDGDVGRRCGRGSRGHAPTERHRRE